MVQKKKKKARSRTAKPKFPPEIVRAHKNYVNAINSNETDRVLAMYDKDALVMQPDGPAVSGRRALRKWADDYFKAFNTRWTKRSLVMWMAGDYGFDQGIDSAVDKPRDGGPTLRYTVKGILIYKRQKDGEFLVYRDIWNYNSPPTISRA